MRRTPSGVGWVTGAALAEGGGFARGAVGAASTWPHATARSAQSPNPRRIARDPTTMREGARYRAVTMIGVDSPLPSPGRIAPQPSGTAGSVHSKSQRPSIGETLTHSALFGFPKSSCQ